MKTRFAHTIEMTEEEYKAQMETIQAGLSNLTSTVRWFFEAVERDEIRNHEFRMAELAKATELAKESTTTSTSAEAGDTNE